MTQIDSKRWQCDLCKEVFLYDPEWYGTTKPIDEYREAFGEEPGVDTQQVCDHCYDLVMGYEKGKVTRQ